MVAVACSLLAAAPACSLLQPPCHSPRSPPSPLPQGKGLPRPDVALAFPELGFHLLFDGTQQRLRLIEVQDATRLLVRAVWGAAVKRGVVRCCAAVRGGPGGLQAGSCAVRCLEDRGAPPLVIASYWSLLGLSNSPLPPPPPQLSYGGRLLGGGPAPPRFGRVCEELGPTYPGEAAGGLYPLQYPGVVFLFPLDPHTAAAAAAAGQPARASMSSSIAGVEFPVPLSTPAARILIHHGSAACLAAARAAPPPPPPAGAAYYEPVEALAGQGLLLSGSGACLRFGDSPQVGGVGRGWAELHAHDVGGNT